MNFKNYGNEPPGDGSGCGRPSGGNYPLIRQSSIYSLTFDEFQTTLGGMGGKDFGSMNMDELLKNIWSAEETQSMAIATVGSSGQELQRQGSLTLPRTLSQKTVDEVWKDLAKEFGGEAGKDGAIASQQTHRQQTLGEVTLEEFLVRAGVVREDAQLPTKPNPNPSGIFGDLTRGSNGNTNGTNVGGFGINFQQPGRGVELMGNRISENNSNHHHATNLPLITNGVRTSQQQQPQQQQQQALLFPKQTTVSYASAMNGSQLGMRGGIVGLNDTGGINGNLVPGGGMGMVGLPARSPALSSDGLAKSNGDSSSVSPVPYVFNGGLRGRKSHNTVDKVVERRQRRMIKNRESAARSRARKQAYTVELEQEVAKLKEENQELRHKQAQIMEMQKNQVMEIIEETGPRKRLRRTQTGPW